ncbi:hypothetical protein RHOSPDRAFT_27214 [Rhodotorula sp. JG-1b]|nr:hypothetical protein RHOSPDRAFT_27214 [Rhodotorula sp. JG-1b]
MPKEFQNERARKPKLRTWLEDPWLTNPTVEQLEAMYSALFNLAEKVFKLNAFPDGEKTCEAAVQKTLAMTPEAIHRCANEELKLLKSDKLLPEFNSKGRKQPRTLPETSNLEQKTLAKELIPWRSAMETHFDSPYLKKLHKEYGNFGRSAILHIFEFSLYEVVKEAIVAYRDKGIKQAVKELDRFWTPTKIEKLIEEGAQDAKAVGRIAAGCPSHQFGPSGTATVCSHASSTGPHSHSPPPPMSSLGLFNPKIAPRIAARVYGIHSRDWERARESALHRGGF